MSIAAKIYNQLGEVAGEINLSEKVFGVKVNPALVHQAMVAQMANERQVLAHTKTIGEVRGGGKKPWRQKGTGRARQGSIRSPQWRGGAVIFGPLKNRNFSKDLNQKMKQKALLMTLSDKLAGNDLLIIENMNMAEYKTKKFEAVIKNFETKIFKDNRIKRSILVINEEKDEMMKRSGRNLAGIEIIYLNNINLVDILKHRKVIITAETAKKLEQVYKK